MLFQTKSRGGLRTVGNVLTRSTRLIGSGGVFALSGVASALWQELFTDAQNTTNFTNTRATDQYVTTDTDALFPVPAGAIPIQNARPVRNLVSSSENLTSDWFVDGGSTIDDFETVSFADSGYTYNLESSVFPIKQGHLYSLRFDAYSTGSDFDLIARVRYGGASLVQETASLTSTTKTFSFCGYLNGADANAVVNFYSDDGAQTAKITNIQVQDITHRAFNNLGADVVVNGIFDTDSDWTFNGSASISGGAANLTAVSDAVKQDLSGTQNTWVLVQFDYVRSTDGDLRIYVGGQVKFDDNMPSASGHYSVVLRGGDFSDEFQVRSDGFIGSIDNVTVRPLSEADLVPDEYVDSATDHGTGVNGFKYFTTALANTVDGSGVVTEATGAALSGISLANVPGATNLLTYSNSNYTISNTTVASDYGVSPTGDINSSLVAETTGSSTHFAAKNYTGYVDGLTYVVSAFVRKTSAVSIVQMTFPSVLFGSQYANFDIDNGTIETVVGCSPGIQEFGQGWFRLWISATCTSSGGGAGGLVLTNNSDATGRVPFYVGDPASTVELAFVQIEEGTIPTPYIPTSGSTASTDSAVLDFSGVTGFATPNETRIVCTGLGPNIVTGGDFSNPSDWTKGGGVTIADGVVEFTGTSVTNCNQIYDFTAGDRYLVIFSVVEYTSGNFRPFIGANNTTAISSAGLKSLVIESNGYDYINIYTNASFIGKIDDLQVYKIDPTRNVDTIIDVNNWDHTDLSDILPHANIKSVTVYAPGERP